jgi:hypothetical protein
MHPSRHAGSLSKDLMEPTFWWVQLRLSDQHNDDPFLFCSAGAAAVAVVQLPQRLPIEHNA